MKRIFALALVCMMTFMLNVCADDYDLIVANYTSYEANTNITVDLGNSAQLLASVARSFYSGGGIDFDLLFSALNEFECNGMIKLNSNEDFSKFRLAYEVKTTVPIRTNRNLKITGELLYSVWMDWDITNPAKPKLEYIYSVPFQDKYLVIDCFNLPGMSETDRANLVSTMKKTFNKEYLDFVSKEMIKAYRDNSTLTVHGKKSIITFDRKGMNNVVLAAVDIISKSFGNSDEYAELVELDGVPVFPTAEQTADFLNKYNVFDDEAMVMEITKTAGGTLSSAAVKVNFAFDIAKFAADKDIGFVTNSPEVLTLSVSSYTEYIAVNKKVDIDFPEINEENAISPFEHADYDWDDENCFHDEYMYCDCDYIMAAEGTCYVSLDEFINAADRYGYDYIIDNNGGRIILTDKNGKDKFKIADMQVNSYDISIDGTKHKLLNPVLDIDGEIFVDTEAIKFIFDGDMVTMSVDMNSNTEYISFCRRSPQCPHDENYEYDDEDYDYDYDYCSHYQEGFIDCEMPYAGTKYLALNDIVELLYYDFTVQSANGVTTLTVGSGEDKFSKVCFGEGNTDMTIDGEWLVAETPTVKYNGTLYISASAAKQVFGLEASDESLNFRTASYNYDGTISPAGVYYGAYFTRKSPSCKHSDDELNYSYPRG